MDTLGTIQNFHHYPLNADACGNIPGGLSVTNDSGAITWGSRSWFFALRIDSTMSPVWGRRYSRHGGFQFIKELPSGDLLAGINMDTAGAVIARMDANGNFLWCKSYIRPRGMVHDAVIESDSSFIITGYTDSTTAIAFIPLPNDYHPKLFMMKLDGGGGVQWCKGYDSAPNLWYSYAGSRIQPTLDGHHVIVATLGVPGYNLFHRPYLMKTDLNGDTLWTRSVGVNGYEYTAADLLVCSDGGIMFSGGILGNLPENQTGMPYIFKTDSLGHFSCADSSYPVVVSDLFPVDSSFTLVSVDGAAMLPAFANDTVFDPIAVYDACLITTIVPSVRAHPPKLSVRPNPTTGFVTMTFADPLAVESYYSVYDAMGRLLYQRPLPTGATAEEIDLSRFGKGTYVIKLTDPDGVCHERVVLE
ncbi:MAG: T9SS type A sorting domain-containing protein [Flavobacteriales bacterium]|nr:T9SS type A sorting domain-containing protein [Flavobacteriales bacterium]MBP6698318.1 T9SS type A sorting domain-containing protein [Flavobacteriales bacterium]